MCLKSARPRGTATPLLHAVAALPDTERVTTMSDDEIDDALAMLRRLVTAVRAGTLDASPGEVVRLGAAIEALLLIRERSTTVRRTVRE